MSVPAVDRELFLSELRLFGSSYLQSDHVAERNGQAYESIETA